MTDRIFTLFETIAGAIFELIACVIFIYLFTKFHSSSTKSILEVSLSMIQYIIFEIITCSLALLYLGYLSIFWNQFEDSYNGYVLFYTGALQNMAITVKPISVVFLGVDRICCVLFPFVYLDRKKYFPIIGNTISVIIVTIIYLSMRTLGNLPQSEITTCSSFGCMTSAESTAVYNIIRYALGGMNIILGIILALLIRKKLTASELKVRLYIS